MTSKERMMRVITGGKPDRLPVTIHQWQAFHLRTFMGGVDQLEAFRQTGLDASVTINPYRARTSPDWAYRAGESWTEGEERFQRHHAQTPSGAIHWITAANAFTTFIVEHPVKTPADLERFLDFWPGQELQKGVVADWYERTGDAGIMRGNPGCFAQSGPWQELCELIGTQEAILWAMDTPQIVHAALARLTAATVRNVHEQLHGAKYDLIEHGGGAASSTVISPTMFREFCVPYDRQIIQALHEEGFPVVYHTCGGMMAILDDIPSNGCDGSETLSPPGVGGDIRTAADRQEVKRRLGCKVFLIGGIDQGNILSKGRPADVQRAVREAFASYGGGGYICSAADHFFDTPVENLRAFAAAAADCRYG